MIHDYLPPIPIKKSAVARRGPRQESWNMDGGLNSVALTASGKK
ncbi:hypothetical protein CPter291_5277 [Collimonas pratensis]|uniref:Uncharacterized protein n=1 Tax=Collimonas pratensis TaxID=279113 RepID=A0ABM5ZE71_9BURK|nr:hypothetical protein CPter291_5277 [Collimonas pratensis]